MVCGLKICRNVKEIVLQCHSEPTFCYKIISQNQCDTASEIFASVLIFSTPLNETCEQETCRALHCRCLLISKRKVQLIEL